MQHADKSSPVVTKGLKLYSSKNFAYWISAFLWSASVTETECAFSTLISSLYAFLVVRRACTEILLFEAKMFPEKNLCLQSCTQQVAPLWWVPGTECDLFIARPNVLVQAQTTQGGKNAERKIGQVGPSDRFISILYETLKPQLPTRPWP